MMPGRRRMRRRSKQSRSIRRIKKLRKWPHLSVEQPVLEDAFWVRDGRRVPGELKEEMVDQDEKVQQDRDQYWQDS